MAETQVDTVAPEFICLHGIGRQGNKRDRIGATVIVDIRSMARKYELPAFLAGTVSQERYERWIRHKARAHVRRDRKRGNTAATNEEYNLAIHRAVIESEGRDFYTGEVLDWSLISKYENAQSKMDGRRYKWTFALLPTVDHVDDGLGPADFMICSWRVNDAKHDLPLAEFLELCEKVIRHHKSSLGAEPPSHLAPSLLKIGNPSGL